RRTTEAVRELKALADDDAPADETATQAFALLRDTARDFLNYCFSA
ncbi:MAG: hypothetical protein JRI97_13135, partial [Deltaproteobacteria bacterium]|nr:hypothetical protein [Deltaproteobacteria bacterium]